MDQLRSVRKLVPIDEAWVRFVIWCLFLSFAYYASLTLPLLRAVWYTLIGVSALAAIAYSLRRRTNNPWAWIWIGIGLFLYFVGDVIFNYYRFALHVARPFPSVADAFFLLARFPLIAGLIQIGRRAGGKGSAYSLLDTLIVASGLALLWWAFLMAPQAYNPAFSPLERFIAVAYPATDFLLLATGIRLAFSSIRRTPASFMLGGALFGLLGADIIYSILQLNHIYQVGTWIDLGWIWFYAFLGAVALYPKGEIKAVPVNLSSHNLAIRLGFLALAALLLPVTITVSRFVPNTLDWVTVGIGTALIVLVLLRLQRLMQHNLELEREVSLWKSDLLFKSIVNRAYSGVCVLNANLEASYANPRMRELADLENPNFRDAIKPEDLPKFERFWQDTLSGDRSIPSIEYRLHDPDGDWRDVESTSNNLLEDDWIHGVVLITSDISERKRYERKLQKMAYTDALTGLPNRAALQEQLQTAIAGAHDFGHLVGAFFFDLDGFSAVNDSLGHSYGDLVLVELSKRLSNVLERNTTIARFGGDEFIVISPNLGQPADGNLICQRLLTQFNRPIEAGGYSIHLTACVGIAISDNPQATPEEIIRNADLALHQAKLTGPGTTRFFNNQLLVATTRRLELASSLRQTLSPATPHSPTVTPTPAVLYQPIYRLSDHTFAGAEAIMVWRHADFGHIDSDELIQIASESNLLDILESELSRQVCSMLNGLTKLELKIALNIPASSLTRPGFDAVMLETLEKRHVQPHHFELEIGEDALVHYDPTASASLVNLLDNGVGITIDNFGREYSSLGQIYRLPKANLKLDRSIIASLDDPDITPMLTSLVTLSHALGRLVIAQGVDNEEQAAELTQLGIDLAQGTYFGKPAPAESLQEHLAKL